MKKKASTGQPRCSPSPSSRELSKGVLEKLMPPVHSRHGDALQRQGMYCAGTFPARRRGSLIDGGGAVNTTLRKANESMYEKVNPRHPDKICDRIAGALVDLAYKKQENPKIAVEVLLGHGKCHIIAETSAKFSYVEVKAVVNRIAGDVYVEYDEVPQDAHLAANQEGAIRCGDNGIFKGVPLTHEQQALSSIARLLYSIYPSDGKYILDVEKNRLIICQSSAENEDIRSRYKNAEINPLGDWTGGPDVDTGATNRKLGSDMADSVTGGGLHGKDLSKADVSVNIYAWLEAQRTDRPVEYCCAIGDETVGGIPYAKMVEVAGDYIKKLGGFEKFAEWGLV